MEAPRVTVLILNYNGSGYLSRFLPSVLATKYPNVEVLVADNASSDDSVTLLRDKFPQVQVVQFPENYGFAEGNNRALPYCTGKYIVLLNSDVEVHPGWLAPLVARAEGNPRIAAVQPKILAERQRTHFEYAGAAGGVIDVLGYAFCRGRVLGRVEPDTGQYPDARPVFWATGACLLVRASVVQEMGLFDPRYFAHYEEIDFCWRVLNAGYEVWVEPAGVVYHVGGGTLPQGSPRKTYLNFRNSLMTLWKNLPPDERAWKLFVRIGLDWVAAAKELAVGKPRIALAIIQAHVGFAQMLATTAPAWAFPIHQRPMHTLPGVFRGALLWRVMVRHQTRYSQFPPHRFEPEDGTGNDT